MRAKISMAPLSNRNRLEMAITWDRPAPGTAIEPSLAQFIAHHLSTLSDLARISDRSLKGRPARDGLNEVPGTYLGETSLQREHFHFLGIFGLAKDRGGGGCRVAWASVANKPLHKTDVEALL